MPEAHKFPEVPSLRRTWEPQSPDPEILSTKVLHAIPLSVPRTNCCWALQLAVKLSVGELGLSYTEKEFVVALAGARCSKVQCRCDRAIVKAVL